MFGLINEIEKESILRNTRLKHPATRINHLLVNRHPDIGQKYMSGFLLLTKKFLLTKKSLFVHGIFLKTLETYYQSSYTIYQKMSKIGVLVPEKK